MQTVSEPIANQAVLSHRVKGLEVVLVSADDSRHDFKQHLAGMPWLAVPHSEMQRRKGLFEHYKVG